MSGKKLKTLPNRLHPSSARRINAKVRYFAIFSPLLMFTATQTIPPEHHFRPFQAHPCPFLVEFQQMLRPDRHVVTHPALPRFSAVVVLPKACAQFAAVRPARPELTLRGTKPAFAHAAIADAAIIRMGSNDCRCHGADFARSDIDDCEFGRNRTCGFAAALSKLRGVGVKLPQPYLRYMRIAREFELLVTPKTDPLPYQ